MRVISVGYRTNRSKPTNIYEHEHAEVHVELGPKDKIEDAFALAEFLAKRQLGLINEKEIKAAAKFSKFVGGTNGERA